jgi:cob(I)alamin adenosyltransferase
MAQNQLHKIKERLAQSPQAVTKEDVAWLIKRVEELQGENEWLKKELPYLEYQGETGL